MVMPTERAYILPMHLQQARDIVTELMVSLIRYFNKLLLLLLKNFLSLHKVYIYCTNFNNLIRKVDIALQSCRWKARSP